MSRVSSTPNANNSWPKILWSSCPRYLRILIIAVMAVQFQEAVRFLLTAVWKTLSVVGTLTATVVIWIARISYAIAVALVRSIAHQALFILRLWTWPLSFLEPYKCDIFVFATCCLILFTLSVLTAFIVFAVWVFSMRLLYSLLPWLAPPPAHAQNAGRRSPRETRRQRREQQAGRRWQRQPRRGQQSTTGSLQPQNPRTSRATTSPLNTTGLARDQSTSSSSLGRQRQPSTSPDEPVATPPTSSDEAPLESTSPLRGSVPGGNWPPQSFFPAMTSRFTAGGSQLGTPSRWQKHHRQHHLEREQQLRLRRRRRSAVGTEVGVDETIHEEEDSSPC